jgi:hypothetical protein
MATMGRLDRRAKTALMGLVVVLAFVFLLTVRSAISAVTPEALIAAPVPGNEDELVRIGGHTLLLKHGSATNRIAHWIYGKSRSSRAFEIGNRSFVPNSDALTSDGENRVGVIAAMMSHVSALKARILVSTLKGDPRIEQLRARHLRDSLIEHGIPAAQVTIASEPIKGGAALSAAPELVLVLST